MIPLCPNFYHWSGAMKSRCPSPSMCKVCIVVERQRIKKSGLYKERDHKKIHLEIYVKSSPISFRENLSGNVRGENTGLTLWNTNESLRGDIRLYNFLSSEMSPASRSHWPWNTHIFEELSLFFLWVIENEL